MDRVRVRTGGVVVIHEAASRALVGSMAGSASSAGSRKMSLLHRRNQHRTEKDSRTGDAVPYMRWRACGVLARVRKLLRGLSARALSCRRGVPGAMSSLEGGR